MSNDSLAMENADGKFMMVVVKFVLYLQFVFYNQFVVSDCSLRSDDHEQNN